MIYNEFRKSEPSFAVWMDYQRAVIYRFEKNPVFLKQMFSEIKGLAKTTGGKASFDPHFSRSISGHKRFEERHRKQLKEFFKEIIGAIPKGSAVFLIGPGLAKSTLKNFIAEHYTHDYRCGGVFASDYLSDAEIAAHLTSLHVSLSQVQEVEPLQSGSVMRHTRLPKPILHNYREDL